MVYESLMKNVSTHMNHNEAWRGCMNLVRNTTINIITLTWFKYNAYAKKNSEAADQNKDFLEVENFLYWKSDTLLNGTLVKRKSTFKSYSESNLAASLLKLYGGGRGEEVVEEVEDKKGRVEG